MSLYAEFLWGLEDPQGVKKSSHKQKLGGLQLPTETQWPSLVSVVCVRFWQNIACVLQTLHQQTRIKNLKDHVILFSEFRMEMITSAFDFAYNFGWREAYPRFFFFFGSISQQEVSDMWILKMVVLEGVVSIFLTLDQRPPVISWCVLASP